MFANGGIFYLLNDTRERNSAQRAAITADGFAWISSRLFDPARMMSLWCIICFYDAAAIILSTYTLTSLSFGYSFFCIRVDLMRGTYDSWNQGYVSQLLVILFS